MNCTYCFNNNIPNHYQTGNSLSTECKGLYFHYDLLLKETIFKSSILSYLPNNPGSFLGGPGTSRVCKITYTTLFHQWIDIVHIHVNYYIIYLLVFSYSILYSFWHAIIHSNGFVQFWTVGQLREESQSHECETLGLVTEALGSDLNLWSHIHHNVGPWTH